MEEQHSALYAAFMAKDARFDGRFFVGISSTGIYCRPVCRAKHAKSENCTFFTSPAEAEQAGYRPCLLCRPELAPGCSTADASVMLARRAALLLEENCGNGQSLEELAESLGCTSRHLRRVFTAEYHVTPVQYLQTCRLLLAKNLLTDTQLSVLEVAMAAGFGSLRRLNDLFQKQYRMSPTALRKRVASGQKHSGNITVALGYRPPYLWDKLLEFLAGRAIRGVEVVKDGSYMRTVQLSSRSGDALRGWICVRNNCQKDVLMVTVSEALIPVLSRVLARVKCLFDLYCDPDAVYETLKEMNDLHSGFFVRGTRVPGCFEPFEMAARAVLGQQIAVKAAGTLAGRIAAAYGTPVDTGIEGLTHTFPAAADVASLGSNIEELFGRLGVISARSRTILELAEALLQGRISLGMCAEPENEMKKLKDIRGIGSWTAQYLAMRTMGWPDAFLETDAGIKKALQPGTPKEMMRLAEKWRPWRSYATVSLWNTL